MLLDFEREEEDAEESSALENIKIYVETRLCQNSSDATARYTSRCLTAMTEIKQWLQKLGDKLAAAQTLGQNQSGSLSEEMETVEFARVSLIQQHELLGVVLTRSVEKKRAEIPDFFDFISYLKKADKYDSLLGKQSHSVFCTCLNSDHLLVHLIPAIGAYISLFGSTEGGYDLIKVRELSSKLFPMNDGPTWPLPQLQATVRSWWLAEYSGFYLDDPPESAIPAGADLDEGMLYKT